MKERYTEEQIIDFLKVADAKQLAEKNATMTAGL